MRWRQRCADPRRLLVSVSPFRLVRGRDETGGGDGGTFSLSPGEHQKCCRWSITQFYRSVLQQRECEFIIRVPTKNNKIQNTKHRIPPAYMPPCVKCLLVKRGSRKREGVGPLRPRVGWNKETCALILETGGGGSREAGSPSSSLPFPQFRLAPSGGNGSQRVGGVVSLLWVLYGLCSPACLSSPYHRYHNGFLCCLSCVFF